MNHQRGLVHKKCCNHNGCGVMIIVMKAVMTVKVRMKNRKVKMRKNKQKKKKKNKMKKKKKNKNKKTKKNKIENLNYYI